jgi:hypothetical protein
MAQMPRTTGARGISCSGGSEWEATDAGDEDRVRMGLERWEGYAVMQGMNPIGCVFPKWQTLKLPLLNSTQRSTSTCDVARDVFQS